MNAALRFGRVLCGAGVLLAGSMAGISIAVVVFTLAGMLVPGEVMYVGMYTPRLVHALGGAVVLAAVTAILGFAYYKLGVAAGLARA